MASSAQSAKRAIKFLNVLMEAIYSKARSGDHSIVDVLVAPLNNHKSPQSPRPPQKYSELKGADEPAEPRLCPLVSGFECFEVVRPKRWHTFLAM